MKIKDRLDELEARLDLMTNRIDHLRDEFVDHIEKENNLKEPLIKDEKIRKAVRAWAEACAVEKCHYDGDGDFATRWHGIKLDGSQIELDEGHYTIAELCGEDKEIKVITHDQKMEMQEGEVEE